MAAPERIVTAELYRRGHPVHGPAEHRVRITDHATSKPVVLAVLTVPEAVALRDALTEVIAEEQQVRQRETTDADIPAGGHDPGAA